MARFFLRLEGRAPGLLMHAWDSAPLLTTTEEEERRRIIAKIDSKRSEDEKALLRRYDTLRSLYVDAERRLIIPSSVIRAALEGGARLTREGASVRQDIIVDETEFTYDDARLGTTPHR
ncbi:MAG: hypothetical protein OXK21_06390 [Chloroflexota bacterium]|nr:hypothetical protein [Chloroflexota bacterium]